MNGESVFGSDLGQLLSKLLKCQSAMFLVYLAFLEQFTKYHVNTLLLLFVEWLQEPFPERFWVSCEWRLCNCVWDRILKCDIIILQFFHLNLQYTQLL